MRAFGLVRALAQNLKNNLGWTGIVVFSIFPPVIPISFLICGLIDLCALPYISANHGVLRQQTILNNYRGYCSSGSPYHSQTMHGYSSTPAVQYGTMPSSRIVDFNGQSNYSPRWYNGTSQYQSSSQQGTSQNRYQSSSHHGTSQNHYQSSSRF